MSDPHTHVGQGSPPQIGTGNLRPAFDLETLVEFLGGAGNREELVALLETVEDDQDLSDIASCVVLDDDIRKAARTVLGRRPRRIRPGDVRSAKMADLTELTRQN